MGRAAQQPYQRQRQERQHNMCETNRVTQVMEKSKECSGDCDNYERKQTQLTGMQEQVALILQQLNQTAK